MNITLSKIQLILVFQYFIFTSGISQKFTSGIIESGFIDIIIIDSTKQALEDAIFFKARALEMNRKEKFYFNDKYQIVVDSMENNRVVKKYLDVASRISYIYYDSVGTRYFAVDSLLYDFINDENLRRSRDSLMSVFETQKRTSDTITILGYNCKILKQDKIGKGQEGYFEMYNTEELGIDYLTPNPISYCKGYPIRIIMAISLELELISGIQKITYLQPDSEIFTKPELVYINISFDKMMEKIYR